MTGRALSPSLASAHRPVSMLCVAAAAVPGLTEERHTSIAVEPGQRVQPPAMEGWKHWAWIRPGHEGESPSRRELLDSWMDGWMDGWMDE